MERIPNVSSHNPIADVAGQEVFDSSISNFLDVIEERHCQKSLQRAEVMGSQEERRELFFRTFATVQLLDKFSEDMEEANFSENEVNKALIEFSSMTNEDVWRSLSYPHELRGGLLARYKEHIETREMSVSDMIEHMRDHARERGFNIGFHASPFEIKPDTKGDWTVRASENDNRDGDLPMAYYSRSYRTMYRKQGPAYLYFVRVSDSDRNDGNWWRASSLSVIQQVSAKEMDTFVRNMEKRMNGRNGKEQAASVRGR